MTTETSIDSNPQGAPPKRPPPRSLLLVIGRWALLGFLMGLATGALGGFAVGLRTGQGRASWVQDLAAAQALALGLLGAILTGTGAALDGWRKRANRVGS